MEREPSPAEPGRPDEPSEPGPRPAGEYNPRSRDHVEDKPIPLEDEIIPHAETPFKRKTPGRKQLAEALERLKPRRKPKHPRSRRTGR